MTDPASVGTRAVLSTDTLWSLVAGVSAYRVEGASFQQALLPSGDFLAVYYEAVVFPEGAWWLPTATVADRGWHGSTWLQATGAIPTVNWLRPVDLYLWVPREAPFDGLFAPVTVPGQVQGDLPAGPPPAKSPIS
jgi:hypothetical protein